MTGDSYVMILGVSLPLKCNGNIIIKNTIVDNYTDSSVAHDCYCYN